MRKNIGSIDRVMRFIIGIVIIALGFIYGSWWGILGFVPIITAFTGFCPLYVPFGISTCKREKES